MLHSLKETKLVRLTKPFLLTVSIAQVFLGTALLGLGIFGILIQSTYSKIGISIWAGFAGCAGSAWWAFSLGRLTERSHGIYLAILVLLGHLTFFILTFFAASSDFTGFLTFLRDFRNSSNSTGESVARAHLYFGRLLVDLHQLVFSLVVTALDLVLLGLGCKIRGAKKMSIVGVAMRIAKRHKQAKNDAEAATLDSSVQDALQDLKKTDPLAVISMLMAAFGILTVSIAALAIAAEIVGLVIAIRFAILPPGWVIFAAILIVVTRRMIRRRKVCWFKFLMGLFIFSCIANCAVIILAILGLKLEWTSIIRTISSNETSIERATQNGSLIMVQPVNLTDNFTFLAGSCCPGADNTTSTPWALDASTTFNPERAAWKMTLATVRFLLIFFLLLMNIAKAVATSYVVKVWSRKRKANKIAQEIEMVPERT